MADFIHPGEEFCQVIITAVALSPRRSKVYFISGLLQPECKDSRNGNSRVPIGFAVTDTPIFSRLNMGLADIIQWVKQFYDGLIRRRGRR